MIMFHGAFKNAGFERTYPNSVTREGVLGSEYNIWSDKASPEHDLLIPFIRMAAGPMDYEPGFMTNVNKRTFRPLPDHVMSQGTRCHQLAMFVAYDSPMQVFSGDPSAAWIDIAYTSFLGSIPTMWDETTVLDAKLGDYLLLLRKKDNDWYIAGMTDWTSRELEVDLSFLGKGKFQITICEDGVNAEKYGSDYKLRFKKVTSSDRLKINMASGGGYVAKIIKLPDGE
jgi:alpha-glucosidase